MAPPGSKKALSIQHEDYVAEAYDGKRSKSSGGHITDAGDVKTNLELFECKYKGSPADPLKKTPLLVQQMEKIANEAWEIGREPVVALRFWLPNSPLAGVSGWVDFSVRLLPEDAVRSEEIQDARGIACPEDGIR